MLNALIFKPSRAPSLPAKSMAFACALLVLSVVAIDANASTAYPVNDEQKQSKISQTATEKSSPNGQVTQSVSVTELLVTQGQNRITMAIIGDGYTASDLITKYQPKVTSTLDYFFNNLEKSTPYPRYKNFINVYRIDIASNESGVDKLSAGIYRDTALGGEDGCTDYTIGICGADWALTHAAFDLAEAEGGFTADWRLVMLNDDAYNAAAHYASDGPLPIYSAHYEGNWDMRDLAMHEGAHAWHYLADEYGGNASAYPYAEPPEVNVTRDPQGGKWQNWLGYVMPDGSVVGAYEGGRYYDFGIYRPTDSSKMNGGPANCHFIGNNCGHNAVGIEKIILDIYALIDPIDSHTNNQTTLTDPSSLAVTVVDPEIIMINWSINGVLVAEKSSGDFVVDEYLDAQMSAAGSYQVTARAWDEVIEHAFSANENPHPLDLVRQNLDSLEQSVTWTVTLQDTDSDAILNLRDNCPQTANQSQLNTDLDQQGDACDSDDDNDGVEDELDQFPLDANESADTDGDGVGDNGDAFPSNSQETLDTDGDGVGNNADTDDDGDGFSDSEEIAQGTDPLSAFSCPEGCANLDIDGSGNYDALTDGLLLLRGLFGLTDSALTNGAVATGATYTTATAIAARISEITEAADIDGNGNADALTDGLVTLRYLFGLRGDVLIADVIAPNASRSTAAEIEAYLQALIPEL